MSRVRHVVDSAKLWIGQIVLRSREGCRPKRRVVCAETSREYVVIPALDQVDAGGALIGQLHDVVCAQLILRAEVPVHGIPGMKIAVHPVNVA